MVTDDEAIHEQVLREVLRAASEMDMRSPPPLMGQRIHRLIRQLTGDSDPYRRHKERFNRLALQLYPELTDRVQQSPAPFETAVRLAIAGNIIDFGVNGRLTASQLHDAIDHSLHAPLSSPAVAALREAAQQAEQIVYLADNAGEIVFDRLLIEQMPLEKITLVVRGMPVINDATLLDAQVTGITDLIEVVDNGSDAPGTVLETCSETFRRRFEDADMIIAKGQGNYETLSDVGRDIFFVLKAKCPVIATHLGCEVGSLIVRRR